MRFPFIVKSHLSSEEIDRWQNFYAEPAEYDFRIHEGVWRRTQEERNQTWSDWRTTSDQRRRLLQFRHHFDVSKNNQGDHHLYMTKSYLWLHYDLPSDEADVLSEAIHDALQENGWVRSTLEGINALWERDGLGLSIEKNQTSDGYISIEYELMTDNYQPTEDFRRRPWDILNTGFRNVLPKGTIQHANYEELLAFLPAHVELGCGPSIEAGIPPLHDLHHVYKVTDPWTKKFVWTFPNDDLLVSLIQEPTGSYQLFASHFLKCFDAEPSNFYRGLAELVSKRLFVAPILNNNFDGLASRAGIKERCIRLFEELEIVPNIDFDRDAKSLFVFGCHADRRRVQEAARLKGLKVVFFDPEGFVVDGEFKPYPLESPQTDDLIFNEGANNAMEKLLATCKMWSSR